MGFNLDYLERSLALSLVACAAQSQQLHEHEDLLERRAQLVRYVGEKSLARLDQADLAAQGSEAGDGEYDARRQEKHRRGHVRRGDSPCHEVTGNLRPQRGPEDSPTNESQGRLS